MNEIREHYKNFEDAFSEYLGSWMEAEKDFGCYLPPNEEELTRLRDRFKSLWEAENCSLEEIEFRYY